MSHSADPWLAPVAVNSVLAIGGVGGLAVGLAGREILENLFTGLIILSSSPFEVGEEIVFTSSPSRVRADPFLAHPRRPHCQERCVWDIWTRWTLMPVKRSQGLAVLAIKRLPGCQQQAQTRKPYSSH